MMVTTRSTDKTNQLAFPSFSFVICQGPWDVSRSLRTDFGFARYVTIPPRPSFGALLSTHRLSTQHEAVFIIWNVGRGT